MNKKTLSSYLDSLEDHYDIRFHENYISIDKAENPGHIVWVTAAQDGRDFISSRSMGNSAGSLLNHEEPANQTRDVRIGTQEWGDTSASRPKFRDDQMVIYWDGRTGGAESNFGSYKEYREFADGKQKGFRFQLSQWLLAITRTFRRD